MQNLLSFIQNLGAFTSKSAFGYPVSAAISPTVFLKSYNLPKSNLGKDGPELVRFSSGQKIGAINRFQWFGDKLMVFVNFDKPVIQAGFTNTVAAWIDPAFLTVEIPTKTVTVSGNKLYYATGSGVNFRATASTSAKSLGKLSKGAAIGESDGKLSNVSGSTGWLKFTHAVWGVGYVRNDFASTTQPTITGTAIVKPTTSGTPSGPLPIQNPFDKPNAETANSKTQKWVVIGGIAVVVVGFIGFLVYNANKTKQIFTQISNGIKRK